MPPDADRTCEPHVEKLDLSGRHNSSASSSDTLYSSDEEEEAVDKKLDDGRFEELKPAGRPAGLSRLLSAGGSALTRTVSNPVSPGPKEQRPGFLRRRTTARPHSERPSAQSILEDDAVAQAYDQATATTTSTSASTASTIMEMENIGKPRDSYEAPTEQMTYRGPPRITFDPWTRKKGIAISLLILLTFDLILPCFLYYVLTYLTDLDAVDVIGYAALCLGLGELIELPVRGWRLWRRRSEVGPLGSERKIEFDVLFWGYLIGTIVAVVPYIIACDGDEPIYWLFLFTPAFLFAFTAFPLFLTMIPFRLPFRISSDPKGTLVKPAVFYIVEDFVAVDANAGRQFREEWALRYDSSPPFRALLREMNAFWAVGLLVFIGALAGVTWGLPFVVAYAVSFALIFVWMGVWAAATYAWVWRFQEHEKQWFAGRAAAWS